MKSFNLKCIKVLKTICRFLESIIRYKYTAIFINNVYLNFKLSKSTGYCISSDSHNISTIYFIETKIAILEQKSLMLRTYNCGEIIH